MGKCNTCYAFGINQNYRAVRPYSNYGAQMRSLQRLSFNQGNKKSTCTHSLRKIKIEYEVVKISGVKLKKNTSISYSYIKPEFKIIKKSENENCKYQFQ